MKHQHIVATWDNGFVFALDGHDVIRRLRLAKVLQRLVENLTGLAQLDAKHDKCSVVDVPALAHPRHLQSVDDIDGSKVLRIDERGDAHTLEERLQLRVHVLVVVDLCHCALGAKGLGKHTGIHVQILVGRDGDEQVGIVNTGIPQRLDSRRRCLNSHQVVIGTDTHQTLRVGVDEHRVVIVA